MSDFNLRDKFPELKPVSSPPVLFTLNGFGFMLHGRRDFDDETGTYIATHCLCALFIPVLALRSYRVANAPNGGWYFIGKEPLSTVARAWNLLVLLAAASAVGWGAWSSYTGSPEYQAGQKLAEADRLAEQGDLVAAATLYREVALGATSHSHDAAGRVLALVEKRLPASQDAAQADAAVEVLNIAVELQDRHMLDDKAALMTHGIALADAHAERDPRSALAILDAVLPLDPQSPQLADRRRIMLESIVAHDGSDVEMVSKLALLYEADEKLDKCEQILTPCADQLGQTEGARILGQILAGQGEFERSHALLEPYCKQRLAQLHEAEQRYEDVNTVARQRVFEELNNGEAPESFYTRYDSAAEDRQREMLEEYVATRLKDDPDCAAVERELIQAAAVVPVALELGIVLLRRGQTLEDPAAREAELGRAEQTFLAIQGVAGESDEYRLYLGQVYYWLGKQEQGRELFDELLASSGRDFPTLTAIASLLRQLGSVAEARALNEEAYEKAATDEQRYQAAMQRALLHVDLEDEITWLQRSDAEAPQVKASLAYALGLQAMQAGDDAEAERQLRRSVEAYANLSETSSTLNNGALASFSLFSITGDPQHSQQGVEMLEKAVSLEPSNSLLLGNASELLLDVAIRDVASDQLDVVALRRDIDFDLLAYLYNNEAQRQSCVERLRKHPMLVKAVEYLDRAAVLAPRRPHSYRQLAKIHAYTRNVDALRALRDRVRAADLDLSDEQRAWQEFQDGTKDAKLKEQLKAELLRLESLAAGASEKGQSKTLAVALSMLAMGKIGAGMTTAGGDDAGEVVELAERALAAAPSRGTRAALCGALYLLASENAAAHDTTYASLIEKWNRSVGPLYLLPITLSAPGPGREAILADPAFQRLLALSKELDADFPHDRGLSEWTLYCHADPAAAAQVAEFAKTDEIGRLRREIDALLATENPSQALTRYWEAQMSGDAKQTAEARQALAEMGFELPQSDDGP